MSDDEYLEHLLAIAPPLNPATRDRIASLFADQPASGAYEYARRADEAA